MGKLLQFKGQIGHPVHGFGFKKDPGVHGMNGLYAPFERHPAALMASGALPASTSNVRFAPPVWDQGQTGSCVGHGTAGMVTTTLAAHGKAPATPVLPRLVYCLARAVDRGNPSQPLQDQGAQPSSVARALGLWGCVLEGEDDGGRTATSPDYTSYLEAHVNDEPKLGELEGAGKRILVGFNSIADADPAKLTKFQQALATGHSVGVAVDAGGDAFQRYDETQGPLDYTGSEPDHWVYLVDFSTVAALRAAGQLPATWTGLADTAVLFLLQNSWGVGQWSQSGRAWVTSRFVQLGCFNSLVANLGV